MKKYTSAIIGCGRIGSSFDDGNSLKDAAFSHAGAYFLYPKTELISGADPSRKQINSFKKRWGEVSVYGNYKDMLRKEKIDLLSVCTPPETHWEVVKEAARFPLKAIYCEKPVATSLEDAKKILDTCRKKNILLAVNHQRRFSPFFQELKRRISSGKMGRIQQVNCFYTRGIMNTGIHLVDLFSFLFGEVEWVEASFSSSKSPFENDPNLDGFIKFKKGPSLSMQACDDASYLILEIDILGEKERIKIGSVLEYFKTEKGKNLLSKNVLIPGKNPFKSSYGAISLEEGVKHIVKCIEKGEKPLSSGDDALKSLNILFSMLSSAEKGKRVQIKK